MRETTVKSRNCIDARFWYHEWEAMKKSTGSHTVRSSLHTTLPWEPIHKLMDSLHTLSLIRRFTSGKAWAVRTSEEAPSYCGSSSRIVEPSSSGGMVIKHTLYREISLWYCYCCLCAALGRHFELCSVYWTVSSPYAYGIRFGITNSGLSLTL